MLPEKNTNSVGTTQSISHEQELKSKHRYLVVKNMNFQSNPATVSKVEEFRTSQNSNIEFDSSIEQSSIKVYNESYYVLQLGFEKKGNLYTFDIRRDYINKIDAIIHKVIKNGKVVLTQEFKCNKESNGEIILVLSNQSIISKEAKVIKNKKIFKGKLSDFKLKLQVSKDHKDIQKIEVVSPIDNGSLATMPFVCDFELPQEFNNKLVKGSDSEYPSEVEDELIGSKKNIEPQNMEKEEDIKQLVNKCIESLRGSDAQFNEKLPEILETFNGKSFNSGLDEAGQIANQELKEQLQTLQIAQGEYLTNLKKEVEEVKEQEKGEVVQKEAEEVECDLRDGLIDGKSNT
ncbi:MAG: hypothetical protein AAFO15_01795 [Pseudomonadota bacterium]